MYANLTKNTIIRLHGNTNEFYITSVGPTFYTATQILQNKFKDGDWSFKQCFHEWMFFIQTICSAVV